MNSEHLTADELTWDERLKQARDTNVGDVWHKKRQPDHWAEVLSTDRSGNLRLRHWNGRVTKKWYSYLASDYVLAKRREL